MSDKRPDSGGENASKEQTKPRDQSPVASQQANQDVGASVIPEVEKEEGSDEETKERPKLMKSPEPDMKRRSTEKSPTLKKTQ